MKHLHWHKVWHDRLLSDPDYVVLSPTARGVLADLRCFAGRKGEDGDTGMTPADIVNWYGRYHRGVRAALDELRQRHFIVAEAEDKTVVIPRWSEAQETPAAARMRAYRQRKETRNSDAAVTRTVTGRGRGRGGLTASPGKPEVWSWWIDAHRNATLPDPLPEGPDLMAAQVLGKHMSSGEVNEEELRSILAHYLADSDPFLGKNGHALRYLGARINAYRQKVCGPAPPPLNPALVNELEGDTTQTERNTSDEHDNDADGAA